MQFAHVFPLALFASAIVLAQPVPPPQNYVADIGTSPLRAPATADFAPGSTFTMEGWFFPTAAAPFGWLMGRGATTPGEVNFGLYYQGDGKALSFRVSPGEPGSNRAAIVSSGIPLRKWTHLAAVMDGTALRVFVNGTLAATSTAVGPPLAAPEYPFRIGRSNLASGAPEFGAFQGYACQIRLWRTARTAAQITAGLLETIPADRTGLVAAWPLDDNSTETARDISGAGRHLQVNSGRGVPVTRALLEPAFFAETEVAPFTIPANEVVNSGAVQLIDFDSDGDLDVIATQGGSGDVRLVAFRNDSGSFADATQAVFGGARIPNSSRPIVVLDLNGDGRMDLFIGGFGLDSPNAPGSQPRIYVQTPDGRLVDETASRLPQRTFRTHVVASGDIDGDGDVDFFYCNIRSSEPGGGPRFVVNNGQGVFTDASDRIPGDIATRAVVFTSATLFDLTGDGRPELILGGESSIPNEILLNDGAGRFTRTNRFRMPEKLFGPQGITTQITCADFNGDGKTDLLAATTGGTSTHPVLGVPQFGYSEPGLQLLLNQGDGTFADGKATREFKWGTDDRWVYATHILDLNRDGFPDFVADMTGAGGHSLRIFLNRGDATFLEVTETFRRSQQGVPMMADFNNDGILDIVSLTKPGLVFARGLKRLENGRLANLSVRTQAGTGDATLITGFALGGGAGSKPLLVRAVGPTLSAFGVGDSLADPAVEIAPLGGAKLVENNDWGGTTALKSRFASVGAFPLAADGSRDAALVFSPNTGSYTARITGANNTTGIALVELYDAGTGNSPRLTNVSARTLVGTGADALIAGFVVDGTLPKRLLIRAAGPTLGAFGVGGALEDPVLTLRPLGSETIVATNDDWGGIDALKAAFASIGGFPFASDSSKDAAIAIELAPGTYTATVSGKNNTTGVALVEVYELP